MQKLADFKLPQFFNYPPYFTLQPVRDTREKQIQLWKELILDYCKSQKIFLIGVEENFPLFSNSAIDRTLSHEARETFLSAIVGEGRAEWLDKGHRKCLILWHRIQDWAEIILKFVRDNGLEDSVMTVEEIRSGTESHGTELQGIDRTILMRALKLLENKGKLALFKGTSADDEGVKFSGARITFAGQVSNHVNTVSQVVNILGDENEADNYLSKCIYSIGLGSNDYLNNYFMPLYYSIGSQYSPDSFANDLINRYTEQLRIMYKNGARKFALIGIGAIGCSPNELAQNSRDGTTCDERINSANRIFNRKLGSLVEHFNQNTPDAKFTYINAYGIFQDMVANAGRYGFRVTNAGCCGVGKNNGQITCLPGQGPCLNREEFVFWDAFHPGEAEIR